MSTVTRCADTKPLSNMFCTAVSSPKSGPCCSVGTVADIKMTLQPNCDTKDLRAAMHGVSKCKGRACGSSTTMTAFTKLCSFRAAPGRPENSDSKNCSEVVTTTGTSQFSASCLCNFSASPEPDQ